MIERVKGMKDAEIAYKNITRPFATVNLDAIDRNIAFVNQKTKHKQIRIATKSVRSIGLLRYVAERLHHHSGFMTFDLRETFYLLNEGFDDLLLGYPQFEESALEDIIPFIRQGKEVTFMVDCLAQWNWLEKFGEKHEILLNICIDINLSVNFKLLYFGTKRSSLHNALAVERLLTEARSFTHTKVIGLMGYEAQIAGVPDLPASRWQAAVISSLKKKSLAKITSLRQEVVEQVREVYPNLQFVNGGGSGSIDFTTAAEEVTEITIGSAFYFPALFSRYDALPLESAVNFALRVTRQPESEVFVCNGGGYIASGAIGEDKNPVPVWPEQLTFLKNEGAGEVQTPLHDPNRQLKIGDTVYFKHAKAGELCERFNELHARRGHVYKGSFKTYRGDGACFL